MQYGNCVRNKRGFAWTIILVIGLASGEGTAFGQQTDPCSQPLDPGKIIPLVPANARPATVLSQLDINGDGVPDGSPDSDGDGLPDNWEVNCLNDTWAVGFFAPTAIGPGTPATFLTVRMVVFTDANNADTDGDGLTDFIEVFGLKYIDDNHNGRLDFIYTDLNHNGRWDPGEPIDPSSEWMDLNGDGLPSIGEWPLANIDPALNRQHDFDGFVFTDPTNWDTDGDGISDGEDLDPLINPQTFGVPLISGFDREYAAPGDEDLDNDGLGNGSDFGNDLIKIVDYPTDFAELLSLFRKDRLDVGTLPESLTEDLLGVDWDGNGLFRITDVRGFHRPKLGFQSATCDVLGLSKNPTIKDRYTELFTVGPYKLYGEYPGACQDPPSLGSTGNGVPTNYAELRQGIGWQEILLPSSRSWPAFPDVRIWTILYAWRMAGFDVDGDGFVGSPENQFAQDDLHLFSGDGSSQNDSATTLDGRIAVPEQYQCGNIGPLFGGMVTCVWPVWMVVNSYRRRRH